MVDTYIIKTNEVDKARRWIGADDFMLSISEILGELRNHLYHGEKIDLDEMCSKLEAISEDYWRG
jgi:hypothetical protein